MSEALVSTLLVLVVAVTFVNIAAFAWFVYEAAKFFRASRRWTS